MARQNDGRETWHRLREWDKGPPPAERLAAQILRTEKFESIDPSHPLGGKDGLKDIVCIKDGKKLVAACYFPRGQQDFKSIKRKFVEDAEGISKNNSDGLIFVTNQELSLSERDALDKLVGEGKELVLYHLERISAILNAPINYGLRLEFLDIEMTKEEQLSFYALTQQALHDLTNAINQLIPRVLEVPQATPVEVVPETFSGVIFPYMKTVTPHHKCSYCGYGFRIFGRDYFGSAVIVSARNYSGIANFELVTCPKCGNVESTS